ncbi:hypothetical protein CEXT_84111 [Caerostris extrusa]|uniref:Uncharacterized protein n=1 Tax=Caerostris extrusa TaxID=172846 RepID=A0AAV4NIT9_CAEEX|nr:hypothetical protein CEXT_84111 [Caerostris extrusa]
MIYVLVCYSIDFKSNVEFPRKSILNVDTYNSRKAGNTSTSPVTTSRSCHTRSTFPVQIRKLDRSGIFYQFLKIFLREKNFKIQSLLNCFYDLHKKPVEKSTS